MSVVKSGIGVRSVVGYFRLGAWRSSQEGAVWRSQRCLYVQNRGGGWTLQAETEHMPRQIEVLTSSPGTNTRKSDGGGGTFFHAGSEHI